jgi:hypothetical protein
MGADPRSLVLLSTAQAVIRGRSALCGSAQEAESRWRSSGSRLGSTS